MNEFKKNRRLEWKLKRIEKGIKLKEISDYVGFSISMLSKYENGHRDMDSYRTKLYKEYILNK